MDKCKSMVLSCVVHRLWRNPEGAILFHFSPTKPLELSPICVHIFCNYPSSLRMETLAERGARAFAMSRLTRVTLLLGLVLLGLHAAHGFRRRDPWRFEYALWAFFSGIVIARLRHTAEECSRHLCCYLRRNAEDCSWHSCYFRAECWEILVNPIAIDLDRIRVDSPSPIAGVKDVAQGFAVNAMANGPIDGTVYGKINTAIIMEDPKAGGGDTYLSNWSSRLGFKGKTKFNSIQT